ncbi:MAG: carboxypeptidase-like regulatory domain-containing protein [Bacteroidetes bacterium]|nr:carboxypeptidase-like regulatory domain-containing protein [Bacteroidota bacterium]
MRIFLIPALVILQTVLFPLYAQINESDSTFMLSARIADAENGRGVSYAHIIFPQRHAGTAADEFGCFDIPVHIYDTLVISAVGYCKRTVVAGALYLNEKGRINLYLVPDVITLKEVDIFPYKTYGQFRNAVLTIVLPAEDKFDVFLNTEQTIRDAVNQGKLEAGGGPFCTVSGPITAVYDKFSKEGRARQEYNRLMAADQICETISKRYNEEIVSRMTGIRDEQVLKAFMEFCRFTNEYLFKATDYEILMAIVQCYEDFSVHEKE